MTEPVPERIGDYEIVEEINPNSGGFAHLYKAKHPQEKGFVAIKRLRDDFLSDHADFADLLQKERDILWELRNGSHIVRAIHYVGKDQTDDGKAYLLLEYVDGENLRDICLPGIPLPLADVVQYVEQIAQALHHAHNRDIYHCDLRPENILKRNTQDRRVELVLCDFGLAVKAQAANFPSRSNLGLNKNYWPPEQRLNWLANAQSDQFAVGVMVYEWLCGEQPFKDDDDKRRDFKSLHEVDANISEDVSRAVSKALHNVSDKRYKDMREFADALAQAANSNLVSNTLNATGSVEKKEEERPPNPAPLPIHAGITQSPTRNASTQPPITRRQVILAGLASIPAAILLPLTWARLLPELEKRLFPPSPVIGTIIQVYRGHRSSINSVAWSPDSTRIVSTSSDGTAQVWDATTGDSQAIFGNYNGLPANGVSWLDDHIIASCSGNLVYVWSADDGSTLYPPYSGHNATVQAVAWAPRPVPWLHNTPQSLASFGNDGFVLLYHYENGQWIPDFQIGPFFPALPHNKENKERPPTLDLGWSFGAQFLAACSTRTDPSVPSVTIWQGNTQEGTDQFPADVGTIAWIDNDMGTETIAIGRRSSPATVQVWKDITESKPTSSAYFYPEEGIWGITKIARSPGGGHLAAAVANVGLVYVWDINDPGNPYKYTGHTQNITNTQARIDIRALAWSPDGTMIASGGTDGTVRVWASGSGISL